MEKPRSSAARVLDGLLSGLLRFPNPGRWGWIVVLFVLLLAFWSVIRSASTLDDLARMLVLVAFTASIVLAERRIHWPEAARRPLSLSMFALGTGLMIYWIVIGGFAPTFSLMALLFAFAVTMREMRSAFLA